MWFILQHFYLCMCVSDEFKGTVWGCLLYRCCSPWNASLICKFKCMCVRVCVYIALVKISQYHLCFRYLEWVCGTMELMWWMHWWNLLYLWYVVFDPCPQRNLLEQLSGPIMIFFCTYIILQASSNGKFVDSCLDMLVSNFTPPKYFLDLLRHPRGHARKEEVLNRVHSALNDITVLVPLAPMRLLPIILQRMPHVFDKEAVSLKLTF